MDIAIEALVETTVRGRNNDLRSGTAHVREHQYIASLCDGRLQSLAEIAARMQLPLGVARVIIADMAADGLVAVYEPTSFDARGFYRRGRPIMRGYFVTHELLEGRIGSDGFDELVGLAISGRLRSDVDLVVPWTEAASAVTALLERRVRGKAVLTVGSS